MPKQASEMLIPITKEVHDSLDYYQPVKATVSLLPVSPGPAVPGAGSPPPPLFRGSHLCEAGGGLLDGDLALVVDAGPNADTLAGDESTPLQLQAAEDWTGAQTAHAELMLHLAVERLLRRETAAAKQHQRCAMISGT